MKRTINAAIARRINRLVEAGWDNARIATALTTHPESISRYVDGWHKLKGTGPYADDAPAETGTDEKPDPTEEFEAGAASTGE